jgi:hypothetical protein
MPSDDDSPCQPHGRRYNSRIKYAVLCRCPTLLNTSTIYSLSPWSVVSFPRPPNYPMITSAWSHGVLSELYPRRRSSLAPSGGPF